MFDFALLFAQFVVMGLLAGWLTTGARDNILYPNQNEDLTAEVLTFARLRDGYPEAYEQLKHRAVESRAKQKWLFGLIVAAECVVSVALWIGCGWLGFAMLTGGDPQTARAVSVLAVTGFITIWGSFLMIGNHFAYWFGHEGAQHTHYNMVLWGMGALLLLALP